MAWNYLQVETAGLRLHPTVGPGGLTYTEAHAHVRRLLVLVAETVPDAVDLVRAWDAGARDDTVYFGTWVWCVYEADDPRAGAREWVEDLASSLRRSGSRVRIAW